MKKTVLLIAALAVVYSTSFAQPGLSTRENNATVEKLGARPVAGDMALTFAFGLFGPDPNDTTETSNNSITGNSKRTTFGIKNLIQPGDFIMVKKYKTDDVAYRMAVRFYKNSAKYKGTTDSLTQIFGGGTGDQQLLEREYKHSMREYNIVPGIEKHHSAGNIFDVYGAADLYLGWKRNVDISNEDYLRGDKQYSKVTTSGFVVGLGAVVGVNVFLGHLPISLGVEYGINAKWTKGGKTKHDIENVSGGVAASQVYYTENIADDGPSNNQYTDLSQSEFGMNTNQNVRVCLNIYFSDQKRD